MDSDEYVTVTVTVTGNGTLLLFQFISCSSFACTVLRALSVYE